MDVREKGKNMQGWPITIWFESKKAAQEAAEAIGCIVGEYDPNPSNTYGGIVRTFGKPSLALEVGLQETVIPPNRKTPWDR